MEAIYEGRGLLISGTMVTIEIFLISVVLMVLCSFAAGMARLVPFWPVRAFAVAYIELFRGTSLVVQLFWLYFALPFFGVSLDVYTAATLGIGLCFGAYGAEVVRSAILSVPKGQHEAATALNMNPLDRMWSIILPQAVVIMLPSFGNLLVLMLKATAAASLITLPELTFQAYSLNVRTLATEEIFIVVLLVYFLLASLISTGVRWLERWASRWRKKV